MTLEVVRDGDFHQALAEGKAVQFWEMDYPTAIARLSKDYPNCDYWYTERNGDPISMVVPKGTPDSMLPNMAMFYIAIEWIKHDADFGGIIGHPGSVFPNPIIQPPSPSTPGQEA